jgi:O-antigen/teichoic acid export membrane protein
MKARLERNALAGLAGTVWSIGLGLACVPLTMRLLGAEAFGLTGVYLTLQSIFVVFDIGIAGTLNREIARLDASGDARQQRDLVFTLQAIYWLVALVVGVTIVAIAPLVAAHWVKPHALSVERVRTCVRMMGVAFAFQFPFVFYQSGLLGLQRHVLFNSVSVVVATLRALGPLLLLWWVSPVPQLFFAAQIVVSAVGTAAVALLLWRCLPAGTSGVAGFRPELIRRVWRFGAAYSANSLANLALRQGDKVLLSALLPLEAFGYYTLAQRLGSGLYALIIAGTGAVFPHFSGVVARNDPAELAHAYHRACQLMAVLIMPAAVVTAVFAPEVLLLWTGDAVAVANTHVVLALIVVGLLFHGIAQAPIYLQIAHDWWRLIGVSNVLLIVTILPLYALMATRYGAPGAAVVWVLLNVGYLATVPVMHRRFLARELRPWLRDDVAAPLGGALLAAGIARWLLPPHLGRLGTFGWVLATGALATAATVACAPHIRALVAPLLRRRLATRIA